VQVARFRRGSCNGLFPQHEVAAGVDEARLQAQPAVGTRNFAFQPQIRDELAHHLFIGAVAVHLAWLYGDNVE